jgi:D-glycero-alpha-D-manno-heptose-7-phosphate kinase
VIISKTPMRLSFAGGGSDLPAYYREEGGAVVSASINKYVYICVNKGFDDTIRVSYSKTEEVKSVGALEHVLVRAALDKLGIKNGIEIASIADIPSRGSGLGSSSAFTVGLLHALHAYNGTYRTKEELAKEACEIEIDICGEPIGKQDQFGAAVGGLKLIRFHPDGGVDVESINMPGDSMFALEKSMMMFYTGIVRSASAILADQQVNLTSDSSKRMATRRMVEIAFQLRDEIARGNVAAVGEAMHAGSLRLSSTKFMKPRLVLALREGSFLGLVEVDFLSSQSPKVDGMRFAKHSSP